MKHGTAAVSAAHIGVYSRVPITMSSGPQSRTMRAVAGSAPDPCRLTASVKEIKVNLHDPNVISVNSRLRQTSYTGGGAFFLSGCSSPWSMARSMALLAFSRGGGQEGLDIKDGPHLQVVWLPRPSILPIRYPISSPPSSGHCLPAILSRCLREAPSPSPSRPRSHPRPRSNTSL